MPHLPRIVLLGLLTLTALTVSAQNAVWDDFRSRSYDGGSGWASDWTEAGESDGPDRGDIRIIDGGGRESLRLKDDGRGVWRRIDLTAAETSHLSYDLRRLDLEDEEDYLWVGVRTAGGAWTEVRRHAGPGTDGAMISHSLDLAEWLGSQADIGFFTSARLGNEDRFLLNRVSASVGGAAGTVQANDDEVVTGSGRRIEINVLANDGEGAGQSASRYRMTSRQETLDARGGELFIPFTTGASGRLAQDRGDGHGAGLAPDTASLSGTDSTGGSVWFDITFDRGGPLTPHLKLNAQATEIVLHLTDIDFSPVTLTSGGLSIEFSERLQLQLIPASGAAPIGPGLVLDRTNYGTYRPDGAGPTDDRSVEYAVPLAVLGASQGDLAAFEASGVFHLRATLSASLVSTGPPGSEADITNGPENLQNTFALAGSARSVPVLVGDPANGTASVAGLSGRVIYEPAAGFAGADAFTYRICDATNSCDEARTTVQVLGEADLSIDYSSDVPAPGQGDTVTLTVSVSNAGPHAARQLEILAPPGDGLTVGPATVSSGRFEAANGRWELDELAPGSTETLTFSGTLQTPSWSGTAEIVGTPSPDPDSLPGDADASQDDFSALSLSSSDAGSGSTGGTESDGRLAGLIARLMLDRRQVAQARADGGVLPREIPFDRSLLVASKSGAFASVASFIPEAGPEGSRSVLVSPEDLLPVTNAREIVAVDYLQDDGRRIGVVFASATDPGTVYDHTKIVCDRLAGATLDHVGLTFVEGRPLIDSRLIQRDGAVESTISFSASHGAAGLEIDSRFLLGEYAFSPSDERVYNFQVWSVSEEWTRQITEGIVRELSGFAPVNWRADAVPVRAPEVFVRSAEYDRGVIRMEIENGEGAEYLELAGGSRTVAEGAPREEFQAAHRLPDHLSELARPVVEVPVGPLFDVDFLLGNSETASRDLLYLADGAWTHGADPASAIDEFRVDAATESGMEQGRWDVQRDAALSGTVAEWAGLFRYLRATGRAVDMSDFDRLNVTAGGRGLLQIVLDKESLESSDQYSVTVPLTEHARQYSFPFDAFALRDGSGGLTPEDLVLLSFYVYPENGGGEPFELRLSDVHFASGSVASVSDPLREVPSSFRLLPGYPNPFNPQTVLPFELDHAGPVHLAVYDGLGREIAVLVDETLPSGRHERVFRAGSLPSGTYVYRLSTEQGTATRSMVLLR